MSGYEAFITEKPNFSVVVPVYGCAACLELLCSRLDEAFSRIAGDCEIILVDDRSPDNAWAAILAVQEKHPNVKGVRLSRNFGQHIAISAGLAAATGDFVVVMDCDLQDPPEEITNLYALIQSGYDVVLGRRVERNHSFFRVYAARIYFWLMSRLTEEHIDGSYGSFSMLTRKVVDEYLRFGERERHFLFIVRWLGFRIGSHEYEHQQREIGKSSYSLRALIRHAVNGLFFQATVLLRWIVGLGLVFATFGLIFAGYFVYQYMANDSILPGWTSLIVLILISTGVILSSLGVIGLYVGKIFEQTKGRPLYVVDVISDRRSK